MTDRPFHGRASAGLVVLALVAGPGRAHACHEQHPSCKAQEIGMGAGLGLGTAILLAALTETAARDVLADRPDGGPPSGAVAGIAAGAAVTTTLIRAILVARQEPAELGSAARLFVTWAIPPLVVGGAAGFLAYSLLPPRRQAGAVTLSAVPMSDGAAAFFELRY